MDVHAHGYGYITVSKQLAKRLVVAATLNAPRRKGVTECVEFMMW